MVTKITRKQYEELCEARSYDKAEFHRLLAKYCDIEARPFVAYSYYDVADNYVGCSDDDQDVRDLLDSAYIDIEDESEELEIGERINN